MEHKIIELLSNKMNSHLKLNEISSMLELDIEELREELLYLERNGIIYHDKNDRYTLLSNTSLKLGVVKVTKSKGVIVVLDDKKEYSLNSNSHGKVIHNDTVLVEVYNKSGSAQLVKLLKRKDYIGEIVKDDSYKIVSKGRNDIILDEAYPLGLRVLVDGMTNKIKEVVGHKDDADIKTKEVLLEHGFPIRFSEEYQRELEDVPTFLTDEIIEDEKKNGRLDLRSIPFVTIDGDDTKDFDDAVSYYNGVFYVSIADTTFAVKEDSAIDIETISRGISVYTPGTVNPMLDHKFSSGICSLVPGEDRFTTSLIAKLDDNNRISSYRLCNSIINSKMRMTYNDVNLYLEKGILLPEYSKYSDMLLKLYDIAMSMKKKMLNEGFLEFSSTEIKFYLEEEKISKIKRRYQGKAEELIEFLMLLKNLTKTSYFIKHGLPFIARNHEEPNHERVTEWNRLLNTRGYKVDVKKKYSNEDIRKSLFSYRGCPEELVLDNIGIRSQAKAKYGAYNKGHFAIGQIAYATFSSPIRRLADYINQRIFNDSLKYGDKYAREKWTPKLELLAKAATDSELRADKVERIMDDLKIAEYMSLIPKGTIYEAIVSEVSEGYIRVILPNMVCGKVYISTKYYKLGKDGFSAYNPKNNEQILVGDTVSVALSKVNVETAEIIFVMNKNKECCYEEEKKKGKTKIKNR